MDDEIDIRELPDDTLTAIFQFLLPKDHITLAICCRRFQRIALSNPVWKQNFILKWEFAQFATHRIDSWYEYYRKR